jgi:hypothetical protein
MDQFEILTNRKRALIALIHVLVFLGIALRGLASPKPAFSLHAPSFASGVVFLLIYLTVTSVLTWLVSIARGAKERAYFALCAGSAALGFFRTWFGDVALPPAQPLRVLLLFSAALMGMWIFRSFPIQPLPDQVS